MDEEMNSPRVAFQGERGAFGEEAALKLLGAEIQLVPRPSFESLFAAIREGLADYALAPLENSLLLYGTLRRVISVI
jgi:prephenate dehydratase